MCGHLLRRRICCAGMQAIIFDMDGVIVDSEPTHVRIETSIFRDLGISLTEAEHREFQGVTSHEIWHTLMQRYGLDLNADTLAAKQRAIFLERLAADEVPLVPGVSDIIRDLATHGSTLAVASSSVRAVVESVLSHAKVAHLFSAIACGDEVAQSKPAPDVFLLAAARLGVSPAECVVIEDSENGVAAAKAAGMHCVGFRNPSSGNPELAAADARVAGAKELSDYLSAQLAR